MALPPIFRIIRLMRFNCIYNVMTLLTKLGLDIVFVGKFFQIIFGPRIRHMSHFYVFVHYLCQNSRFNRSVCLNS